MRTSTTFEHKYLFFVSQINLKLIFITLPNLEKSFSKSSSVQLCGKLPTKTCWVSGYELTLFDPIPPIVRRRSFKEPKIFFLKVLDFLNILNQCKTHLTILIRPVVVLIEAIAIPIPVTFTIPITVPVTISTTRPRGSSLISNTFIQDKIVQLILVNFFFRDKYLTWSVPLKLSSPVVMSSVTGVRVLKFSWRRGTSRCWNCSRCWANRWTSSPGGRGLLGDHWAMGCSRCRAWLDKVSISWWALSKRLSNRWSWNKYAIDLFIGKKIGQFQLWYSHGSCWLAFSGFSLADSASSFWTSSAESSLDSVSVEPLAPLVACGAVFGWSLLFYRIRKFKSSIFLKYLIKHQSNLPIFPLNFLEETWVAENLSKSR